MPKKKIKTQEINIDFLSKTPVIIIDKSADCLLELVSIDIIEHISITDLRGKSIHESDINGNKFVFTYPSGCKDMFLLKIRKQKHKAESQILIL